VRLAEGTKGDREIVSKQTNKRLGAGSGMREQVWLS
jgi:hypothetical protein